MKSQLKPLGKILNFLGVYTFRVHDTIDLGDKVKVTFDEGFNFKNPLTYVITPFIIILAILDGGVSEVKALFKRETFTAYESKKERK